jgi:hypothetical protein
MKNCECLTVHFLVFVFFGFVRSSSCCSYRDHPTMELQRVAASERTVVAREHAYLAGMQNELAAQA